MIVVQNLVKKYKEAVVLKNVSFSLADKEQCVIQGSSGSGKSTLLYLLGGLEKPSKGKISFDGKEITSFNDEKLALYRNRYIGFIFQFHFLLPSMNCLSNILLPANIGGLPLSKVKKWVRLMASELGVESCLKKYPSEISGGEQQRVNLIRALSLRPKLLLCDEPTGNLDQENSQNVVSILSRLAREYEATLLIVTHDATVASRFPRRMLIQDGVIIEDRAHLE